jgi:hypothetical protein
MPLFRRWHTARNVVAQKAAGFSRYSLPHEALMKTASLVTLLLALTSVACSVGTGDPAIMIPNPGGSVTPPGTSPLPVDPPGTPGTPGTPEPEPVGGLPGAACRELAGDRAELTDHARALAAFQGTWELCSADVRYPGTFPDDVAGLSVAGDRVSVLVKNGEALESGATAKHSLGVRVSPYNHSYQVELLYSGGGYNNFQLEMTADRSQLRLSAGTSGNVFHFGRLSPGSVVRQCTGLASPAHAYASTDDVSARLAGKWQLCSGGISSPSGTAGIEFTRTNAFLLVKGAGGAIVRGGTWDYERSLSFIDTTGMNGAGVYQINMSSGNGGNGYFSKVAEDGGWLELEEGTSGRRARYERLR